MRVLLVTHRMPWPAAGGAKVRAFHMIEHLRARGHQVILAAPVRDAEEQAGIAAWQQRGVEVLAEPVGTLGSLVRALAYVPTPLPSSFGFFWSPALARRVRERLRDDPPDVAVAYSSSVARYLDRAGRVPKMLDFVDSDGRKWLDYVDHARFPMNLVYAIEGRKLRRLEYAFADRFDLCTAISTTELKILETTGRRARYAWFANGVDHGYFAPRAAHPDAGREINFVGRMDYYPNIQGVLWFVAEVWPRLRARWPDLRMRIIGAEPVVDIRALDGRDGVTVTGTVDDVRDHLARGAINVAPLLIARGMQNKVLEAMAMGLPVVCSPDAADGIEARVGSEMCVARDAGDFTTQVADLLEHPERRAAIGTAARARIVADYGWDRMLDRFADRLEELAQATPVRP